METGTHPHLLIIEDDVLLSDMTKRLLTQHGYCVTSAYSGSEALLLIEKGTFDLILLDLMLPGIPGETVLEKMKSTMDIPIIGVSAKTDIDSKVNLIRNGADDYITKPFSMPLLLRRIEAVLRRTQGTEVNHDVLSYQQIQLDTKKYQVFVSGQEVALTAREFEILHLLMENPGRVFTREQLLDIIWNYDYVGDDKIINTHIKNIRKKLGVDCIETIRGVGYRIDKEN